MRWSEAEVEDKKKITEVEAANESVAETDCNRQKSPILCILITKFS